MWDDLYRRLQEGRVDLFIATFTCISGDASDLFDAVLHTRDPERHYGSANFMGYSNPELDALVESAATTLRSKERRARLERATRIALEDLPLIPLYSPRALYAVRSDLIWSPRPDQRLYGNEIDY